MWAIMFFCLICNCVYIIQMHSPTILVSLVVVLVPFTWTMLLAVAVRVTSLTAHGAPLSAVTLHVGVLEWDAKVHLWFNKCLIYTEFSHILNSLLQSIWKPTALMEMSVSWEAPISMKVEWRYASMTSGGQYVMTTGTTLMLLWSASSWGTLEVNTVYECVHAYFNFIYCTCTFRWQSI